MAHPARLPSAARVSTSVSSCRGQEHERAGGRDCIIHPVEHRLPVDGTLDLHAFRPEEAADAVAAYLDACAEAGVLDVRVVHGKGTGAMRRTVEAALRRHPLVARFGPADESAGGWGATLVRLARPGP